MDQNSPERVAFVSRALKWSTGGSGKLGHPRLHQLLALTLWKGIRWCRTVYASCNSWSLTIVINIVIVLLDVTILVGFVLCCVCQRCFCISISWIGHTSPFVYSDFTEDLISACFRTKLQWVSLSLSAFIWRGGLCTDACGVFSVTRLPQWGWHVCGAGRPTVSVIIVCFYKLTAICDELLVCMCFSCPCSHFFIILCLIPSSRFLCLKNKNGASVVFSTYTEKHPSIEKGPPFVQPLLNFIWFLLLAVDG